MLTLSYGIKKPQSGDKGPVVFPALEANFQQQNDHNHDGANSAPLSAKAIIVDTQTLLAAAWVSVGDGQYRQLVTMLAGYDFDKTSIGFRLPAGHYLYPTVERVGATQFYVYTNDNTTDYIAVYGG